MDGPGRSSSPGPGGGSLSGSNTPTAARTPNGGVPGRSPRTPGSPQHAPAAAPVSLPIVLDGGHAPAAGGGPASVVASDDELGEEDLFGSEGEEGLGVAPQASSGGASRGAPFSASPVLTARAEATPIPDEKDLFGEDSGDELDEKALFGSEEEGGAEIDEKELFGSEEEDGASKAAPKATGEPQTPAQSEISEMDEREIFGDVSDDEPEKAEDVILRRRPAPGDDRVFMSMRLPNVLSIEKAAFDPNNLSAAALDGYHGWKNTLNKKMTRLLNPENCVRWRFKKGPDGHNMTDEDGRPQYESNSRFVEWEDGSKTLFVGKEAFNILEIEDKVYLFEENSQDVHVCHGFVNKRLVATPTDLKSATHSMLKKSQFRTFEANRRSLLMSQEEQDANQALQELTNEHKQKVRRDEQKHKRTLEQGGDAMTAAFLEDDQPGGGGGSGPSIMDVKQQARREDKRHRSG